MEVLDVLHDRFGHTSCVRLPFLVTCPSPPAFGVPEHAPPSPQTVKQVTTTLPSLAKLRLLLPLVQICGSSPRGSFDDKHVYASAAAWNQLPTLPEQ
jgi:hypothetical protein